MRPKLIDDMLNAQHEQFVAQMKSELQIIFSGPIIEQGIDERHDCRFQADIVLVLANAAIQIVDDRLNKVKSEIAKLFYMFATFGHLLTLKM